MKTNNNIHYILRHQPKSSLFIKSKISQLQELLIQNPSIINAIDEKGETIFSNALKSNNYEIYDLILKSSILNLKFKNNDGNSYLHLAVINQNEDIVKALIKKGINLNIQNKVGNTALHLAYEYGNSSIIKLLTQKGINSLIKNKDGKIAKEITEINKNKSINYNNYNNFMNRTVGNNQSDFRINKNILKPKRKNNNENIIYNINNKKIKDKDKDNSDNNIIYKEHSKYFSKNHFFIIKKKKEIYDNKIDKNTNFELFDKKKKTEKLRKFGSYIDKEEKSLNKISFKDYNINNNNNKQDELLIKNSDNINLLNNTSKETKFVTDTKDKSNNLDEVSSSGVTQSIDPTKLNSIDKHKISNDKKDNENKNNNLINDKNNNNNFFNDKKLKQKEKKGKNYKSYVNLNNINGEKFNTIQNNYSQNSTSEKITSNNILKYKIKNHLNNIHKSKTKRKNQQFSNKIINKAKSLRVLKNQNSFTNNASTKKNGLKKEVNDDDNSNIKINHILKKRNINRKKYDAFPFEKILKEENNKKILTYIEVKKNKSSTDNKFINNLDENGLTMKSGQLLKNFLSQINMDKYIGILALNGFDDINLILEQSKNGIASIQDSELKEAGIKMPGDRAKILIRIQELSNNFVFPIPKEVYYSNEKINTFENDNKIKKLKEWLKSLKLDNYFMNFINCGYYSIDLLFMQMVSSNPINNEILKDEIGIQKVGYRSRIINKLKEDSKNYIDKLSLNMLEMNKGEENTNNCQCTII